MSYASDLKAMIQSFSTSGTLSYLGSNIEKVIWDGTVIWQKIKTVTGNYFSTTANKNSATVTVTLPSGATDSGGTLKTGEKGFLGTQTSTDYYRNVAGSSSGTAGTTVKVALGKTLHVNKVKFKAANVNTATYQIGYWNTSGSWKSVQAVTSTTATTITINADVTAIGFKSVHQTTATSGNTNLHVHYLDITSWDE